MYQVYLQCTPVITNHQTEEYRSHVIPLKGSIINAPDELTAMAAAKTKHPQYGARLLVGRTFAGARRAH